MSVNVAKYHRPAASRRCSYSPAGHSSAQLLKRRKQELPTAWWHFFIREMACIMYFVESLLVYGKAARCFCEEQASSSMASSSTSVLSKKNCYGRPLARLRHKTIWRDDAGAAIELIHGALPWIYSLVLSFNWWNDWCNFVIKLLVIINNMRPSFASR